MQKSVNFMGFSAENPIKLTLWLAPRTGFEPAAYRLGGGHSIQLSYRGLFNSIRRFFPAFSCGEGSEARSKCGRDALIDPAFP